MVLYLPEAAATVVLLRLLSEESERTLLGLVARRDEAAERLLARGRCAAAHNASTLVKKEILLRQPTGRVLGVTVKDLYAATDCRNIHLFYRNTIFFSNHVGIRPATLVGITFSSNHRSNWSKSGCGSNARALSNAAVDRRL